MHKKQPSFLVRNGSQFSLQDKNQVRPIVLSGTPVSKISGRQQLVSRHLKQQMSVLNFEGFPSARQKSPVSIEFRVERTERVRIPPLKLNKLSHSSKISDFTPSTQVTKKFMEASPIGQPRVPIWTKGVANHYLNQYKSLKRQISSGRLTSRHYDLYMKPKKVVGKFSHNHLFKKEMLQIPLSDPSFVLILFNYYLNSPDSPSAKMEALDQISKSIGLGQRQDHILRAIEQLKEQRLQHMD